MFNRPGFWPAFVTLAALAVTLGLGVWQVQRLAWKESLIAQAEQAQAAPVIDLNAPDAPPLDTLTWRNVTLRGRFLHGKELHLVGQSPSGEAGYHLVTPLLLEGTDAPVLVDRGWAPFKLKERATRPETLTEGVASFTGIVLSPKGKRLFTPENRPEDNLWLWYDFPAMKQAAGLNFPPAVIAATSATARGDLPRPDPGRPSFRNDHLGYAVTWFLIAACILAIFLIYHRKTQ